MNKLITYTLIAVVFLSACTPSTESVQTAIAETQKAVQAQSTSTPLPTQIPFSALQLDNLVIQPNDLPAGVSGAQISNYEDCNSSAGDICAEYFFNQDLEFQNQKRGEIIIWVYEDKQYVNARYKMILDSFTKECQKTEGQCYPEDPKTIPNLGDESIMIDVYNYIGADIFHIGFTRCNAVVYVKIGQVANDPDSLITYARRLDDRLKSIICE